VRFIVQIILVSLFIYLILSVLRMLLAPFVAMKRTQPTPRYNPDVALDTLVKDPVCGTYGAAKTALRVGEHLFCSEECARKWSEDSRRLKSR
jgi:YHS domain-containing protein